MTENGRIAADALGRLEGFGVRHFVLCAGARNAPLVTSLLAAAETKNLRLWHHFDERTAAFFALGLAKKRGEPAAVVTTSGTAVAELLPATIEGWYAGVPLVLLTADRPARFRGSGAPQAIEQQGIFGPYAFVVEEDLDRLAEWRRNEPLHCNLCFEEPHPDDRVSDWETRGALDPTGKPGTDSREEMEKFCGEAERLLVLLGELPGSVRPGIEAFLHRLGAPVWAEATSGLRESGILGGYLVRDEKKVADLGPSHILRIGGVPSLRFWRDLEEREEIRVLSLARRPFSGLARDSVLLPLTEESWVDDPTSAVPTPLIPTQAGGGALPYTPTPERDAIAELSRRIPREALVYLGNSLPIREWNAAASVDVPHPRCFASRGANGIDGQVATFFGLSESEDESWAILGDLTALYDLDAPALLGQLSHGRRRIVVLNNGGGRIFSRLPSLAGLTESEKKLTENRHAWRFDHWAAQWGMDYASWKVGETIPELEAPAVVLEVEIESE